MNETESDNISEASTESESLLPTASPDDPINLIGSPEPLTVSSSVKISHKSEENASFPQDSHPGTSLTDNCSSLNRNVSQHKNESVCSANISSADDSFIPCTAEAVQFNKQSLCLGTDKSLGRKADPGNTVTRICESEEEEEDSIISPTPRQKTLRSSLGDRKSTATPCQETPKLGGEGWHLLL